MLDFFTVVEDIGHGEGLANTIRDRFVRLLLWTVEGILCCRERGLKSIDTIIWNSFVSVYRRKVC